MKYYLDDAATSAVNSKVLKAMLPFFKDRYGNASSQHEMGQDSRKAVEISRKYIAEYIGAKPQEIYFTSGVTESNNWVFQGLARAYKTKKKIIISSIEHGSTIEICNYLEKNGYKISKIPVDKEGFVNIDKLRSEIDSNTLVVSIMHANNLFGTIQNISQISKLCREKRVLFHTDASQTLGKLKIEVKSMNIDLLSGCAHKINGPKGIGFLYVKESVMIGPLIFGGGQQKGMRGGTENVPAIVGLAESLRVRKIDIKKIKRLQSLLISELESFGQINGSKENRLPGNVHVSFSGVDSGTLIEILSRKRIYVSSGSACDSKRVHEDYVLKSIGLSDNLIRGSIRITLNDKLNEKDVGYIASVIKNSVYKIRLE